MKIDPEALLTTLIGDLSEVRGRVEALEGQDLASAVEELKTRLAGITESLEKLRAEEESGDKAGPGTAPDWTQVDQEEARELWHWLLTWCGQVLYPMYAEAIWRPCWYRHPRVRVELTWLCAYWYWAYEKKAPPTRAAEWHARWWPYAEGMLQKELQHCGYANGDKEITHEVPIEQDLAENDFVDSPEELESFVEAHIARRPPPKKSNGT